MKLEDVFAPEAIHLALLDLDGKKDSAGPDGMLLSDLEDYLLLNPNWCYDEAGQINYRCGAVREYFILNHKRKQRAIYQFNALDRLVGRSLSQLLEGVLDPYLSPHCYSYRDEMGLKDAVLAMKGYIEAGYDTLLEFDVSAYFENIPHSPLLKRLQHVIADERVVKLIRSFIKAPIHPESGEAPYVKRKGLITGAAISPILSNFYLAEFDRFIDEMGVRYVRYGDDYFLYFEDEIVAMSAWLKLREALTDYELVVNERKSGIFSPFRKKILGYYFTQTPHGVIVDRPPKEGTVFDRWEKQPIEPVDPKFDIISDGILTQQHWNLLFDGDHGKFHLPSQVTDYLNVYSDVAFDRRVIELLSERGIRVNIMDKFGEKIAAIEPVNQRFDMKTVHKQLLAYDDEAVRLEVAREMEAAILHNLRSVLRYYLKHEQVADLAHRIEALTADLAELEAARSVNALLLIEARARQTYFGAYKHVIDEKGFAFHERSRRPPKDAINALISFGNVYLYNYVASLIYRSPLDIRFSFLHAATRRAENLQLDIADIFKPIIVERTIFSLINRQMLRADVHFEEVRVGQETGVYLNRAGKRIFLKALKEKLRTVITVKGRKRRYRDVIRDEIYQLYHYLNEGRPYKAYRHRN